MIAKSNPRLRGPFADQMPIIHAIGIARKIVYQKSSNCFLLVHSWVRYRQLSIMYQSSRAEKFSSEVLLPVLETQDPAQPIRTPRKYVLLIAAAISCCFIFFSNVLPACLPKPGLAPIQVDHTTPNISTASSRLDDFRICSIENFQATHFPFLDGVQPISRDEFVARRQRLAQALISDGADAFVVEPGKSRIRVQYYARHDLLMCTIL